MSEINTMCSFHQKQADEYRNLTYNPGRPTEWPGNGFLQDNRTSHETRRKDWERKSAEQIALITSICTSGRSPQCSFIR